MPGAATGLVGRRGATAAVAGAAPVMTWYRDAVVAAVPAMLRNRRRDVPAGGWSMGFLQTSKGDFRQ